MSRGQTTIEFIVLIGFMLFVFTAFFLVVQQRSSVLNQELYLRDLKSTSQLLDDEITLAQEVRYGYVREFTLPSTIGGEPYTIRLSNSSEFSIKRTSSSEEYVVFLTAPVLLGNTSKDCFKSTGYISPGAKYTIIKLPSVATLGLINDSIGLYESQYGSEPDFNSTCNP